MDILSGCRLRLQNNLTEQVLPGYGLIFRQGERARKKDAQFPKRPIRDWQAGLSTPPGEDVPATARTSRVVLRRSPFCSQCGRRCVHTLSLAGHIVKPRPQEKAAQFPRRPATLEADSPMNRPLSPFHASTALWRVPAGEEATRSDMSRFTPFWVIWPLPGRRGGVLS